MEKVTRTKDGHATRGRRSVVAFGVAALLVAAGCSSQSSSTSTTAAVTTTTSATTVRIGLEGPLSGSQSSVGIGMLDAARLAATNLNASGGILGKKVVIVPIDDKADPATGVAAATRAIASGLNGVVGPYNSGVGIKTLPLYLKAGLVPIRLTSANSTEGLGVTLQPMTSQIAPVATAAITDWKKVGSVALVYDKTQTYTVDANSAMTSSLKAAGVTITSDTAIVPGKKSYASTIATVEATHPQLIYIITYYPEAGLIAKAMFEAKSPTQCLADFGAYDNEFIPTAGIAAAKNCPVVGVPAPNDFANSASIVDLYTTTFHTAPGTWSPYAYDSVQILANAATSAGGFSSAKLKAALNAQSDWMGWTGSVSFPAATGDRVPPSVAVVVSNDAGEFHEDRSWAAATNASF